MSKPKSKIHQYQWLVKGKAGSMPFELTVLARDEEQAKAFASDEMVDWTAGRERFTSVEKTGYVLVLESDL